MEIKAEKRRTAKKAAAVVLAAAIILSSSTAAALSVVDTNDESIRQTQRSTTLSNTNCSAATYLWQITTVIR